MVPKCRFVERLIWRLWAMRPCIHFANEIIFARCREMTTHFCDFNERNMMDAIRVYGASAKGLRTECSQPKNKFFSSANVRHQNNMISRINLLWVRCRCLCACMAIVHVCVRLFGAWEHIRCLNSASEHRTLIHFSLMPRFITIISFLYICGVMWHSAVDFHHFPTNK